ncbi:MAG: hypothetical protein ACQEXV_01285 [Bacillota bacterium]
MSLSDHRDNTSDMALLRKTHDDLWISLQHIPAEDALKLLHSFSTQIEIYHEKKHKAADWKSYLKTPLPYIAIAVGILLPTAAWLLILFLP